MGKNKERARFAVVISDSDEFNLAPDWKLSTINSGVPIDTVIMQLRAFIKSYENNYFEDFNNKLRK